MRKEATFLEMVFFPYSFPVRKLQKGIIVDNNRRFEKKEAEPRKETSTNAKQSENFLRQKFEDAERRKTPPDAYGSMPTKMSLNKQVSESKLGEHEQKSKGETTEKEKRGTVYDKMPSFKKSVSEKMFSKEERQGAKSEQKKPLEIKEYQRQPTEYTGMPAQPNTPQAFHPSEITRKEERLPTDRDKSKITTLRIPRTGGDRNLPTIEGKPINLDDSQIRRNRSKDTNKG